MRDDLVNDTHPGIEAFIIEQYRRMTPSQKLERVTALTQTVQELALADIRRRHPGCSAKEESLRLASRWLTAELMQRALGWNVSEAGY